MSNTMMLYLMTRLDGLIVFCGVLVGLWAIATIILGVHISMDIADPFRSEEEKKQKHPLKKWLILSIVLTLFFSVFLVFVPTSKEMAFIYLGGKLADYGSNNKELQEIPDNEIKLLNGKLKEYIEDQEKK